MKRSTAAALAAVALPATPLYSACTNDSGPEARPSSFTSSQAPKGPMIEQMKHRVPKLSPGFAQDFLAVGKAVASVQLNGPNKSRPLTLVVESKPSLDGPQQLSFVIQGSTDPDMNQTDAPEVFQRRFRNLQIYAHGQWTQAALVGVDNTPSNQNPDCRNVSPTYRFALAIKDRIPDSATILTVRAAFDGEKKPREGTVELNSVGQLTTGPKAVKFGQVTNMC